MNFQTISRMNQTAYAGAVILLTSSGLSFGASGASRQAAPAAFSGDHQVVDLLGKPVAGASVLVQPEPVAPLPEHTTETSASETDAGGAFSDPTQATDKSLIVIRKSGQAMVAYRAGAVPPKIVLPPTMMIKGSVVDEAGTSLPNVLIGPIRPPYRCGDHGTQAPHPMVYPVRFVKSDEEGNFVIPQLPLHNYELQASYPGKVSHIVAVKPGEQARIKMEPGGTTVTGYLRGSKDQAPQAGQWIQADSAEVRLYAKTDAEGKFEFYNLPHREWTFNVYSGPASPRYSAKAVDVPQAPEETSVTLLVNQGTAIGGSVIDAETNEPMQGVALGLTGTDDQRMTTVTDSNGSFLFPNANALGQFTIKFDTVKYVRTLPDGSTRDYYDVPMSEGSDQTTLMIPLRKRAPVTGKVIDGLGAAVPGAQVTLRALSAGKILAGKGDDQYRKPLEFLAQTDSNGLFKMGVYPPGSYEALANTIEGNAISQPVIVDALTTQPAPAIELRLQTMAAMGGSVTNAQGQPVAKAEVVAMPANDDPARVLQPGEMAERPTAQTANNGEFTLDRLTPLQKVLVRATHPDYAQPAHGIFVPGSADTSTTEAVKLVFPAGGEIKVKVIGENNEVLMGAEVEVHYVKDLDGKRMSRTTDGFGFAAFHSLPVMKLDRLVVRHNLYADYDTSKNVDLPQSEFVVNLTRKGSIKVHVDGPVPQSPDAPANVQAVLLTAGNAGAQENMDTKAPPIESFSEQTRNKVTGSEVLFNELNPGWYKAALVVGNGYAETEPVYLKGGSAPVELSIKVPVPGTLQGVVLDKKTRAPIPGVTITAEPAANVMNVTIPATPARSDEQGNFTIANVPMGGLKLKALAPSYPETEMYIQLSGKASDRVEILMSNAPGGLGGTISLAGRPLDSALVILSKKQALETPVASSLTDSAGKYTLSGFQVGSYVLTVEAPVGSGESVTRRTIEVAIADANARQDVDIPLPSPVGGRVTVGGKTPPVKDGAGLVLLFIPKGGGGEGRTITIKPDGTYASELEPGTYSVGLEDRPGHDVEVPTGGNMNLDLAF